jgi:hypothetical protein
MFAVKRTNQILLGNYIRQALGTHSVFKIPIALIAKLEKNIGLLESLVSFQIQERRTSIFPLTKAPSAIDILETIASPLIDPSLRMSR